MRRTIEIEIGYVNHVGEVVEIAISGGAVFDDFSNADKALTDGVGQVSIGESDDYIEVISHCTDELAQ